MLIRCPECNRLLLKIKLNGSLRYEIKCPKCKFKTVSLLIDNEYTVRNSKRRNYKKD